MNEDSLYNRLAKGILTDEEIDNLVDEIMNIPVEKNNNFLSSYGSINVDDLINYIKEFRKTPSFDNLLKENQQLKEQLQQKQDIINKVKEFVCDYKKQWVLNDDVVDDMEVLLEILDNKGE